MIESIEIVKNNASVSVGSGAMAGAIIITTKQMNHNFKHSIWGKQEFGSFGFDKETIGTENQIRSLNLQLLLSRLHSDNDYKYQTRVYANKPSETGRRVNNAKDIYDINLKAQLNNQLVQTTYSGIYEQFEKQLPGGYNFEMHYDKALQTGYLSRHNLKLKTKWGIEHTNYWHQSFSDYDNTKSSTTSSFLKSHNDNKLTKYGSILNWLKKNETTSINIKIEIGNEEYSSKDFVIDANSVSKKENSFYAGSLAYGIKPQLGEYLFELDGSLRYDNYKLFDEFISYRLYGGVL